VIRLGLRLTLRGDREAAVRLAITTLAVAIGVGMLLITLAGTNALRAQSRRADWLHPGPAPVTGLGPAAGTRGPLVWVSGTDEFEGQTIERVDVAVAGRLAPVPPGLTRLPGPGQFYASPALTTLLRTTPAGELRDRYPGRQAGVIGPAALPAPNSLVIIVGHRPAQLVRVPGAARISRITTAATGSGSAGTGMSTSSLEVVLAVAALALLVPVLMFISTATRLSAARRELRFAAMRLVGATPRQVSVVSAVEASLSAALGTAAGFGLFFLLRVPVAGIPFTGSPFFPSEMALSLPDILGVAVGIPLLAVAVARIALRRVQISPLGVSRRARPAPPHWYRILPLAAGVAELGYFAAAGHPHTVGGQTLAFFAGFLLAIAGLITAGPWLTMAGSRILARRAARPAALIAGRRLSDRPRLAFRAVSGLIVALFVTSVAVGIITTLSVDEGAPRGGPAAAGTLADQFTPSYDPASGQVVPAAARVSPAVIGQLRSITGVASVTVHHAPRRAGGGPGPLASEVVVHTDGSSRAIERARTVLEIAVPYLGTPTTVGEQNDQAHRQIIQWQHDAAVLILASLPIAGCSLAVSVVAGLTERQRPFSLLRLTGVSLGTLRRVVAFESVVPLIIVAVTSAGAGLLAAELFLRAQFSVSMRSPSALYYLSVLAGLVLSLAVIAATLPLLDRITGPEAARNE
jgi:hypothetical protein